jgi:hypothetical protein
MAILMKKKSLRLLAAAFFLLSVTPLAAAVQPTTISDLRERLQVSWAEVPKKVLAFYYGWYGNPQTSQRWVHWAEVDAAAQRIGSSTHYPALGPYDSHDPEVVAQHCRWAKAAGIDGFIVSWWRPRDFHDRGLPLLLDSAARFGLQITVYFETAPRRQHAEAVKYVEYLLEKYGQHEAWLKVNGKPVLFIYGRALGEIGLEGWLQVISAVNHSPGGGALFIGDRIARNAARIFDGIHTYNTTGECQSKSPEELNAWANVAFPQVMETAGSGRIACVTIIPGYDDSKLGRPVPRPITARHGGQTYRVQWEAALAANPDWILITSWNEWHEGSEIEPSIEHGERELRATAEYARRFKSLPPRSRASTEDAESAIAAPEMEALKRALSVRPIAVLPGADSEAFWSLLGLSSSVRRMRWAEVVDPSTFNANQFAVVLYAGGESYTPSVRKPNDVAYALRKYVHEGGTLLVCPSEPMPFHYDEGRQAVAHWRQLGLPLGIAWESPPLGQELVFVVKAKDRLPHVPERFAFPTTGDQRWRPVLPKRAREGVVVEPLVALEDRQGATQGLGMARLSVGEGRILYAWFRLLEGKEGERMLHDLWSLAVSRTD